MRQYGIKLIVLWLQSLQDKAGDACIELLASAIPHFPPKKTPLGLPMETTPLTTPTSSHSLCERYGRYSSNEAPPDRHGNETPPLSPYHSFVVKIKEKLLSFLKSQNPCTCILYHKFNF